MKAGNPLDSLDWIFIKIILEFPKKFPKKFRITSNFKNIPFDLKVQRDFSETISL